MTYVKIPDHLYLEAPMLAVSAAARWTNVAGWMYCSTARSDGFVPVGALGTLGADRSLALELEAVGLWVPVSGGWTIAAYLENNRSREEIERISAERRRAGAIGGKQKRTNLLERGLSNAVAAADLDPYPHSRGTITISSSSKDVASCYDDSALSEQLAAVGIDDPAALLAEHGRGLVEAWLAELPNRPNLTNPAGFLVGRLTGGQMPPARPRPAPTQLERITREKARDFVAATPPLDLRQAPRDAASA